MQNNFLKDMRRSVSCRRMLIVSAALSLLGTGSAMAANTPNAAPPGHTLGLALTWMHWSIYQTPEGKSECPNGMNGGSREELLMQFPDKPGAPPRTIEETELNREMGTWHPDAVRYNFPFKEAQGKISYGMNLDGKVGPNDFTSPEGEPGIDNQLFRAIGCVDGWRAPFGVLDALGLTRMFKNSEFDRVLVEITGIDSLANSSNVEVTTYRGLDPLLTDATGTTVMPGGSQRIDTRYGARLVSHRHGKIVDGTLITEPADWVFPEYQVSTQLMHDARFKLKLTPNGADGMIAGYADIKDWYDVFVKGWSTIRSGQGLASEPSHARILERLADAYPDPKTGKNTAISSALDAKFVQVFIQHPAPAQAMATPVGQQQAAGDR